MTKPKEKNSSPKLKSFHIIIMSCLLASLMILNSNNVNEKRAIKRSSIETKISFNQMTSLRKLQGPEMNHEESDKVCSRGSDSLVEYYKTGDLTKIDLDGDEIECEDKDKDYMQALIEIVKKNVGGDDDDEEDEQRLRDLEDEDDGGIDKDNIIKYGMRILPMLIFLVIGILSIFGWIVCCFCNCCNCCCCCCCKKPKCKIPCFIFTYVFYALVVAVCVYGLTQSNKIFTGLANTECSLLKLLEQVVDGEIKQTTPRWIGISGINDLLDNLVIQINGLKDNALTNLRTKKDVITEKKDSFTTKMKDFDDTCYNNGLYLSGFTKTFSAISLSEYKDKTYVLDINKLVGHYDSVKKEYPDQTFLYYLNMEYSEIAGRTDGYVETSETSFNNILNEKSSDVIESLGKAQETLDKLKKPFDNINDKIGDKISDYAELIDKYGKLVVKLVFGVLMVMNIGLAVFLLLIGLFSMQACNDCCFCRCLFKSGAHILWNILALMMILTFLVGSLLALVGRVGGDAMSLVSFIMSKENFQNEENPLLLGQLGDAKKYLNICLHGNGSLESEFDLGDSLDAIEDIDDVLNGIANVTTQFINIKNNLPAFITFKEQIKDRTEYRTSEFGLLGVSDTESNIILRIVLSSLNHEIEQEGKQETWDIDGDKTKTCDSGSSDGFAPGDYKLHPSTCKPRNRDWIQTSSNSKIKDYSEIISSIVDLVSELNDGPFKNNLIELENKYNLYMNSYIEMLNFLNETIGSLIGEIKSSVGDGQIFSFLNGKFIGTNIKIILKYLKYSLGQDLYTVGLCLIIVGCSLVLSVSSTILLIVIINISLEENQRQQNPGNDGVQNVPYMNEPRQISMPNY